MLKSSLMIFSIVMIVPVILSKNSRSGLKNVEVDNYGSHPRLISLSFRLWYLIEETNRIFADIYVVAVY